MQKLYIIHGWTYNIEPWQKVATELKTHEIDVELLHVPGLTAPSKKVWTTAEYVEWAEQNLPKGAIVLGHSNGGRILLNLINTYPDKLKGVILLNSAGIYEKSFKRNIIRKLSKFFAPLKNIKLLRKVFHRLIGASDYANAPKNMQKTLQNVIDSDKNLEIKSNIQTRLIWGEDDQITPLRQGRKIHAGLENSKLKVKKGWPHSPYLKNPEELAKVINQEYQDLVAEIAETQKTQKAKQ